MEGNDSPQEVIEKFQRRQQFTPFIIGGLAILFIMIGVIILIVWLAGPNRPALAFLASATPTPTQTYTVTITPSPTATETSTETPTLTVTVTETATPSGPFEYVVQQNDNCYELSQKFKVDIAVLLAINNFASGCPIHPTQKILIPAPGQKLPTDTPISPNTPKGTKVDYAIQSGDTIASIASKFNANVDDILKDNKITDPSKIFVGNILHIKMNVVTPTKTMVPTSTPAPSKTPTQPGAPVTVTPTKGS